MTDSPAPATKKLDHELVGGVAWTVGAKWLSQLVSWPAVFITARLLSPGDFGLSEMAGFYFVVANVVAEFGIGMAVLQMRELDQKIIRQLNTVAALSGALAFLISVASARQIAAFFHEPALRNLVIFASVSFILTSLEAIPLGLLQRDMEYKRLSVAESVQAVLTAFVAVGSALAGFGYWSLVVGNLTGRAGNIACALYWRRVGFSWPRRAEIMTPLRFGMEIAVQRVVGTLNSMSDLMVIGRTMGPVPLGAYRLATNLAATPSEKIGSLIMRVTGPLFARVQKDRQLVLRYFLIFSEALAMSVFPLLFGLAAVAPEAVDLLLGAKWAAAAAPLRWLAVFMTLRTLGSLMYQLLATLRLTRFGIWMSFLNLAIMPVAFYILSRYGVGAVALAWLIMSPVTLVPIAARVFREIGCGIPQYLNALLPASLGSAAMILAVVALRSVRELHGWPGLLFEVAVGAAVYAAVMLGLFRGRVMRFVHFFQDLRRTKNAAEVAVG